MVNAKHLKKLLACSITKIPSASLVENNPTAKTAARARNNAIWHLLLDEDSTNMTFPFGKITRDLSKFFLRAIQ